MAATAAKPHGPRSGNAVPAASAGIADPADRPFLLEPPAPAEAAVLLVHGFAASPWELRSVGEAVAAAGFTALGVRLPGHGTSPEDLAGRRYEEWLAEVERGWQLLAGRGLRVYGVGQSTGALLLLALAAERPLAGLVLLSPFLRLRHPLAPLAGLLRHLRPYYRPPGTELPHYYERRPLAGIWQIGRLLARVKPELARISAPTLALGADGDRTARPASGEALLRRLGSPRKQYHRFGPESPHVLTTPENPRWREVVSRTVDFLLSLERRSPP
jgi:carboxylesterase